MKHFKKLSLVLLVLIGFHSAMAQANKDFPKEINSIKMTATGLAVVATDDALYAIDNTGKEIWKNTKLRKVDATKITVLEGSELIFVVGGFKGGGNRVINVLTGKYYGDGLDISNARVIHGTNQVWLKTRLHGIYVWDITTYTELYKFEKLDLPYGISDKDNFSGVQPITYTGPETGIIHVGLSQLGEYNLLNGEPVWNFDWKPYKVKKPNGDKGDRPSELKRGYAVMKIDNPTNTLYFPFREMLIAVDTKTGKSKWDIKANKIGKVLDIYITDNGIVTRTGNGIQLIDPNTGTTKWDKPIKVKGSGGILVFNDGFFYVVSKKSIEKVDIANRKSTTLVDKIKFDGGDSFSNLELINGVVILSGSQNLVGVNKESGEILFTTYYKAPGPSLVSIAQNVALAGIAMTATYNSYDNNKNAGNKSYYQYTPAMRSSGGSSTATDNNLYINTKFKDADADGFGIARIDKETGKTINKFVIGNRDPIYDVDENNGFIFYKSDKTSLEIKKI
jgi:hypothetical protein